MTEWADRVGKGQHREHTNSGVQQGSALCVYYGVFLRFLVKYIQVQYVKKVRS